MKEYNKKERIIKYFKNIPNSIKKDKRAEIKSIWNTLERVFGAIFIFSGLIIFFFKNITPKTTGAVVSLATSTGDISSIFTIALVLIGAFLLVKGFKD